MTPAHLNTSLKRDGAIVFETVPNDDEEERRESRRRTILQNVSSDVDSSLIAENETLKKCLEIYNTNKLSRENAWSVPLIDTLYTLLDRHHKSMYNFKIASSSLEASSKVYGLRVDSIHMDVLRMTAGLSARKFNAKQMENEDEEDNVATGGEGSNDPNSTATIPENVNKQKPKRKRKAAHTVTKNKETLNAYLDTVPLHDPIFNKLNSTVGSINSSIRLMNNILLTIDSNLKLCANFPIWDNSELPPIDYTVIKQLDSKWLKTMVACKSLLSIQNLENLKLRPLHTGYVISETPLAMDEDYFDINCNDNESITQETNSDNLVNAADVAETCASPNVQMTSHSVHEISMAFDVNAECEPMPQLSRQVPLIGINFNEQDNLTTEEQIVVNHCCALRKKPVLIEDMRPIDANSQLEYSYRPLDSISHFWAGPSHWKLKRFRRPQSYGQTNLDSGQILPQKCARKNKLVKKDKSKPLNFAETNSIIKESFINCNEHFNNRRYKIQNWDHKKVRLPDDFKIPLNYFEHFTLAPWHKFHNHTSNDHLVTFPPDNLNDNNVTNLLRNSMMADHHQHSDNITAYDNEDNANDNTLVDNNANLFMDNDCKSIPDADRGDNYHNDTNLEIASEFTGAPIQVTKIILPFAKRAKVVDMKNLRRSCSTLLTKQFTNSVMHEDIQAGNPLMKKEQYTDGIASFRTLYTDLPQLLTQKMKNALSIPIALYAVLQLANEQELRLFPQNDLGDFKIRKIA